MKRIALLTVAALAAAITVSRADERRFNYTYEPEVLPKGAFEFEQWVTLRSQRTKAGTVQQGNFNRWQIREELEYGVSDRATVALYLNGEATSFKDFSATPPASSSTTEFTGVSLEGRYQLLSPARNPVGLTLYFEPRFGSSEIELEQKIILGQRHGDWKWALNLGHAVEWKNDLHDREGELELSFGLARDLGKHWSLGLELRNHNELPDYRRWENTALFLGPVVNYRQEKFWTTLTVLPQIYGRNFLGNPDGNTSLDLAGHERIHVRLILGISF
jgi:hypothetical protein